MSSHVWHLVYQTIKDVDRGMPRTGRKCRYPDTLIVAMYFWSVGHDRPLCWAADRANYCGPFRPRRLPSRSQFCRRIKTPRCEALVREVQRCLGEIDEASGLFLMDGRPLPVGGYTQDGDAQRGYAFGRFARGYRLHALASQSGEIAAFRVTSLNVSEHNVAFELITERAPQGIVLADGVYSSSKLYDHVLAHGALLFTPLPKGAGGGHRPQSAIRQFAARLWQADGHLLYRERVGIERIFSQQSSFGGGLAPLPAWVRTLPRVRRWVTAKLAIYHARLRLRKAVA